MKITLEMPGVSECRITDCAYNANHACHARAITIGDGDNPGCDTFLMGRGHARETQRMAGVGACKVTSCKYNDDFECMAGEIHVGYASSLVNCLTFTAR
ncbi:MAG: DUF1540 domain-containing protein [Nitrospirota bacterium]|jgi:hypothetical protein